MKRHTFKDWLLATRPWSFPASAMPVAVTLAYLWWTQTEMQIGLGLWALGGIILFHAAGNTWSDWWDYRRGVDAPDTYGARTLTDGAFAPHEILTLSLTLLALATLSGLGLLWCTGPELLWFGLGGLVCTLLYPAMKFRALGDANILLTYAILPTLGTAFVATGRVEWSVLWLSVPIGLITVGIVHSNNTRDISTDRRAGITSLAMKLGTQLSVWTYAFEVLFPFVWVSTLAVAGLFPWSTLAVWAALPAALQNARLMLRTPREGMAVIGTLDELTAKLQLLFSLLLALSFVAARFFSL